jgi:ketosteroid isomerase-like protein
MSQENVEPFRRFLAAFNRGDLEGAIALVDPPPEFEFVASGLLLPDLAAVQRGPEGLRRTAELFWAEFDDPYVELVELIDAGDQVFTSVIFRGRGRLSGVETNWDLWGRMDRAGRPPGSLAGVHGPCPSPRSRRAAGVGGWTF